MTASPVNTKHTIQNRNISRDDFIEPKGAFTPGHINVLHPETGRYYSKHQERIPSAKYTDLSLMFMWRLQNNKEVATNEKTEKLYEIIQDQHITISIYLLILFL